MPTRSALLGLLILAVAPPFVARAAGTFVGASTMFTQLERYHVEISVHTPAGNEPMPLHLLAPHMSRDARNILLPSEGHAVGASQIAIVAGGLADIARLVCLVRPDASSAVVELERDPFDHHEPAVERVERACSSVR